MYSSGKHDAKPRRCWCCELEVMSASPLHQLLARLQMNNTRTHRVELLKTVDFVSTKETEVALTFLA